VSDPADRIFLLAAVLLASVATVYWLGRIVLH